MRKKYEIDENDRCLPFVYDLPKSTRIYIDTIKDIKISNEIISKSVLLGIDTETKPSFYNNNNKSNYHSSFNRRSMNKTALLQIATRDSNNNEHVLLYDLLVIMSDKVLYHLFSQSINKILINKDIVKIGQSLLNDFIELCDSYQNINCFHQVNSVIDTNDIIKYIDPSIKMLKSLKYFVKTYLHCNLIKTEQLSNWARRPLSEDQLHYASCDALVLLRLYDVMICEAKELSRGKEFNVSILLVNFDYKAHLSNKRVVINKSESIDRIKVINSDIELNVINSHTTTNTISSNSNVTNEETISDKEIDSQIFSKHTRFISNNKVVSESHHKKKSFEWMPLHCINKQQSAVAIGAIANKVLKKRRIQ